MGLITQEGPAAVREAITELEKAVELPPLEWRSGMAKACQDHIDDTGILGITGHTGNDGSSPYNRMDRYGQWGIWAAENISYRSNTGEDIVMQLYIDDGVPSRGHRHNLMDENAAVTGVATGWHLIYDIMACITYAGSYDDNTGSDSSITISSTAEIIIDIESGIEPCDPLESIDAFPEYQEIIYYLGDPATDSYTV